MSQKISIFPISSLSKNTLDSFFADFSENIWQTIEWNKNILETGYEQEWYIIRWENIAGIFEKRSIGLRKFGLFCIGGPVCNTSVTEEDIQLWIQEVKNFTKKEGVLFVQIEPLTAMDFSGFQNAAFKKFIEPYTIIVDITQEESDILSQMKEKGRYNIRLAQKRNVSVKMENPTEENLQIFFSLFEETLLRDGFSWNDRGYYQRLLALLSEKNLGGLFIARNADGIPVAAAISVFYKKTALYYYGASSSQAELRRDMGAYLIQWEMILEAKRRGCETYDFLGIAPEGSVEHHLEGVTDFKKKFGGSIVVWPNASMYIPNMLQYYGFLVLRWIARSLRKIQNLYK